MTFINEENLFNFIFKNYFKLLQNKEIVANIYSRTLLMLLYYYYRILMLLSSF